MTMANVLMRIPTPGFVLAALLFVNATEAQPIYTPGGPEALSPDLVARALTDSAYAIALCENRIGKGAKDYELRSGRNLMNSDYPSYLNQNRVKALWVVEGWAGGLDRLVVYEEVVALTRRPCFIPGLDTRWILVFRKDLEPKLSLRWAAVGEAAPFTMEVWRLADLETGIARCDGGELTTQTIEDLRALAATGGRPQSLGTLASSLKTDLGRAVWARLVTRSAGEGAP